MAQMEWRKYPDVMPDADDIYLAVVEYDMHNGTKEYSVLSIAFTHDLAEACRWDHDFEGEHRPGWYDTQPDFYNECDKNWELDVVYWMPFPDLPDGLKGE